MEFQFPNPILVQNSGQTAKKWQNDAFINIQLPRADGTMGKLGSIGLKLSKPSEKSLIEYLREDPERVVELLKHAHFDFRMADGTTSAGFALPVEAPAQAAQG